MTVQADTLLTVKQIIWSLVAVLWGTLKIRDATAQVPQYIFEQENNWTFGQIVPALLLAIPIFSTIIQFASNWTVSEYSDCLDLHGLSARDFRFTKPYPFATQISELPGLLTDVYTSHASWLWPSLVGMLVPALYFTFEAFSHNFGPATGMKPFDSLVEVWFTQFGLLWYMFLGTPCVYSSILAIGLALDSWFESPSKLVTRCKSFLYLVLVIFMGLAYAASWLCLVYFGFQSHLFEGLYMSDSAFDKIFLHIVTCVVIAFLYYVFYLCVAIPVEVWRRKEVQNHSLPTRSMISP